MTSRIALIIPHFGKFNNYFQLWLNSCKYNPTIDWLVFTDDKTSYDYPSNVLVTHMNFEEFQNLITQKLDMEIELKTPYLICEFRIAFGEIFEDYLVNYDFWGYCDTDLLWGNLRRHITEDVLKNHSKIGWRGHLTLYKNDKRINRLYRNSLEGVEFYKYAFNNHSGFPSASDERHINVIFEEAGEPIYTKLVFADLKIRANNFWLLHFSETESYKNEKQVFFWEKGEIYRLYVNEGKMYKENFTYIHFLKRPMKMIDTIQEEAKVLIAPNFLKPVSAYPSIHEIINYSKKSIYWSYIISKLNLRYIKEKIRYYKAKKKFDTEYAFMPKKMSRFVIPNVNSELL